MTPTVAHSIAATVSFDDFVDSDLTPSEYATAILQSLEKVRLKMKFIRRFSDLCDAASATQTVFTTVFPNYIDRDSPLSQVLKHFLPSQNRISRDPHLWRKVDHLAATNKSKLSLI